MFFNKKVYNLKTIKNIKLGNDVKIVCFGDSITWGYNFGIQTRLNYPRRLKEKILKKYPNSKLSIINEGHSGWTSLNALNYIDNILNLKPNLVIIMFGINDVRKHISLQEYLNNMKNIINKIKKIGSDVIVLSPTKINKKINDKVDFYYKAIFKLSKTKNICFIDIRKVMQEVINLCGFDEDEFISIDKLHLKKDKYKIISNIIYKEMFNKNT